MIIKDTVEITNRIMNRFCVGCWAGCDNNKGIVCSACQVSACMDEIDDAPTVDAMPVIHAYWRSEGGKRARFCSHCNHDEPYKFADTETDIYAYCPHCGSRMDERKDSDTDGKCEKV